MAKKYKPHKGDKITFHHKRIPQTGTVTFVGEGAVSVYPHTMTVLDPKGETLDLEWWVEYSDIVGKAKS
jgi:hypothetical protein